MKKNIGRHCFHCQTSIFTFVPYLSNEGSLLCSNCHNILVPSLQDGRNFKIQVDKVLSGQKLENVKIPIVQSY